MENNPFDKDEKITLSSRKKWYWLSITIALLNPILCGLILGITLRTEKNFKKEARTILIISVVWGIVLIYLSEWLMSQGYLSR